MGQMKGLCFALLFALSGCTNSEEAQRTLLDAGYSDVETRGHAAFRCGANDWSATYFEATNPAGRQVSGVVCCGLLKGCTIRH